MLFRSTFWLALALATPLSACAPGASSSSCPVVKPYTPAEQSALATALDALPGDSPLRGAIDDYGVLRDQARACK